MTIAKTVAAMSLICFRMVCWIPGLLIGSENQHYGGGMPMGDRSPASGGKRCRRIGGPSQAKVPKPPDDGLFAPGGRMT